MKRLTESHDKVVVATWQESGGVENNAWVEKLSALEESGVPVFVCDGDSCPEIAKQLGSTKPGETIVFQKGKEIGRVIPTADSLDDIAKVREIAAR